jgi:hypothetical protein
MRDLLSHFVVINLELILAKAFHVAALTVGYDHIHTDKVCRDLVLRFMTPEVARTAEPWGTLRNCCAKRRIIEYEPLCDLQNGEVFRNRFRYAYCEQRYF